MVIRAPVPIIIRNFRVVNQLNPGTSLKPSSSSISGERPILPQAQIFTCVARIAVIQNVLKYENDIFADIGISTTHFSFYIFFRISNPSK
jgi:hypothetical protein